MSTLSRLRRRLRVLLVPLAAALATACDHVEERVWSAPLGPDNPTGALEVVVSPATRGFPVRIEGPQDRFIVVEQGGGSLLDDLPPGDYRAHLEPEDTTGLIIVDDSVAVEVEEDDTARVRFIAPPASDTLEPGDSVRGSLTDAPTVPHGILLRVEEGDTVDLRFMVERERTSLYNLYFVPLVYGPEGRRYGFPSDEEADVRTAFRIREAGTLAPDRTGIWPGIVGTASGWVRIVVTVEGDSRGWAPEEYRVVTRRSGPILKVLRRLPGTPSPRAVLRGTWEFGVLEDTLWLWNAGAGTGHWGAPDGEQRLSFEPASHDLPRLTGVAADPGDPPDDALRVFARVDVSDLEQDHWFEAPFDVEGDDWTEPRPEVFQVYVYDPLVDTVFHEADGIRYGDIVAHPDGSAVLGNEAGLVKVDLEAGTTAPIPSFLDADPEGLYLHDVRLDIAPDTSLYVLHREGRGELWRIRPDGSQEQVIVGDENGPEHVRDVAAMSGDTLYLAVASGGVWRVDSSDTVRVADPGGACCEQVARDPANDRILVANAPEDGPAEFLAYEPSTGSLTRLGDVPDGAVGSFTVGESGRVYATGSLEHGNAVFDFDPDTGTSGGELHLVGPEFQRGVAVAEGRLLVTAGYLDIGGIAVDDGPGW